jgi:hypothetical protein
LFSELLVVYVKYHERDQHQGDFPCFSFSGWYSFEVFWSILTSVLKMVYKDTV